MYVATAINTSVHWYSYINTCNTVCIRTYINIHIMYMQYVYTIQTYLPTYVYHMYSTHYSIA